MDTAASDLYEGLMSELECPVCLENMVPPIYLCENGHNICKNCRQKMSCCPICRHEFTNIRSLAMEKLSALQQGSPCVYRIYGCKTLCGVRRSDHEDVCPFGIYSCPFRCPENFTRKYLIQHIKEVHKDMFLQCNDRTTIIKLEEYDITEDYDVIIMFYEEVFVCTVRTINGIWYLLLQYIGPEQYAGNFRYKLCLGNMDDDAFIKVRQRCRSLNEDVNEIYRTCKCIILPAEVICHALIEGELCFYFKITK